MVGIVPLTGDPEQCVSLFRDQVQTWFQTCGVQPLNDTFACEAPSSHGTISLSTSYPSGFSVELVSLNETALKSDISSYFCANENNVDPDGTILDTVTGPYSCVVVKHRSILEVLALSFSNASFVYAFFLVFLYNAAQGARAEAETTSVQEEFSYLKN